jgi:hypothetical protein
MVKVQGLGAGRSGRLLVVLGLGALIAAAAYLVATQLL